MFKMAVGFLVGVWLGVFLGVAIMCFEL